MSFITNPPFSIESILVVIEAVALLLPLKRIDNLKVLRFVMPIFLLAGLSLLLFQSVKSIVYLGLFLARYTPLSFNAVIIYALWLARATVWNSGHALVWISLSLALLYILFLTRFQAIQSLTFIGSIIAVHELEWYVFYFIHTQAYFTQNLLQYSPFMMFVGMFIMLSVLKFHTYDYMVIEFVPLMLYYIVWLILGFPITLDLHAGMTPYYYSVWVNQIETVSWLTAVISALIGLRAELLRGGKHA